MRLAVAVHAGIHYPKFDALQLRQYADRRAAVQKIGHHLRGHLARIRADTAFRNTVVRSEHDAHRLNDLDVQCSLNRAYLGGQRLEPAPVHRAASSAHRGAGIPRPDSTSSTGGIALKDARSRR